MHKLSYGLITFLLITFLSGCTVPFARFVEFNQDGTQSEVVQNGYIEGPLSYPSEVIPDTLQVCALNLADSEEICTQTQIQDQKFTPTGVGFRLEVPAGKYHVYSYLTTQPEYKAYFSEFVLCGLSFECGSHTPVEINVYPGITTPDVKPHDWYATSTESSQEETNEQDLSETDTEPDNVCWNRVIQEEDVLYWRDGCRGNPSTDMMCTMALVELTESEVESYRSWVRAGSQTPEECL